MKIFVVFLVVLVHCAWIDVCTGTEDKDSNDGKTQIHKDFMAAVVEDDFNTIQNLISDGNNGLTNATMDHGLNVGSLLGKYRIVDLLLKSGANINARDKKQRTPLHNAAWSLAGRADDIARLLIQNGADVNAKDGEGYTPLHWCAYFGWADQARILLQHGADRNLLTNGGATALSLAEQRTDLEYSGEPYRQIARMLRWP